MIYYGDAFFEHALYFWNFTHKMIPALAKENQPPTAMIRNQKEQMKYI